MKFQKLLTATFSFVFLAPWAARSENAQPADVFYHVILKTAGSPQGTAKRLRDPTNPESDSELSITLIGDKGTAKAHSLNRLDIVNPRTGDMYDDREQGRTDIHPPFADIDIGTLQEVKFELFPRKRDGKIDDWHCANATIRYNGQRYFVRSFWIGDETVQGVKRSTVVTMAVKRLK